MLYLCYTQYLRGPCKKTKEFTITFLIAVEQFGLAPLVTNIILRFAISISIQLPKKLIQYAWSCYYEAAGHSMVFPEERYIRAMDLQCLEQDDFSRS